MTKFKPLMIGLGVTLAATSISFSAMAGIGSAKKATYEVIFVPTFTSVTHPYHYRVGVERATHFSPLIAATYKRGYWLYRVGRKATPGLELLAERGKAEGKIEDTDKKVVGLLPELKKAKKKGWVYSYKVTDDGNFGPVPKPVELTLKVLSSYPLASVGGMVAPSPDWFAGVTNVKLYSKGHWVPSKTVIAYAYDAGTDAGTDYTSDNKNQVPKKNVTLAKTRHFINEATGRINPVGTFVFFRVPNDYKS